MAYSPMCGDEEKSSISDAMAGLVSCEGGNFFYYHTKMKLILKNSNR